jgi:hypothetical protein
MITFGIQQKGAGEGALMTDSLNEAASLTSYFLEYPEAKVY